MPTLPIPLFVSIVLVFLLITVLVHRRRHLLLAVLLGVCALQGIVISLAQHYGVSAFWYVQPFTASCIPALAWICFQGLAVRGTLAPRDAAHGLAPAFPLVFLWAFPQAVDWSIAILFLGYGMAMLAVLARGPDALPRMRLDAGDIPARIWRLIAIALILSAASDALIAAAHAAGLESWQPWIVSVSSSVMLLMVGSLGLTPDLPTSEAASAAPPESAVTASDREIMDRLDAYMTGERPYLDPNLTLARLVRRLGVPSKQLSAAINRATGENVSRYVNTRRIHAACQALLDGETVTAAMLVAGFNTKSNFNREFQRIKGTAPSAWLARQPGRASVSDH